MRTYYSSDKKRREETKRKKREEKRLKRLNKNASAGADSEVEAKNAPEGVAAVNEASEKNPPTM